MSKIGEKNQFTFVLCHGFMLSEWCTITQDLRENRKRGITQQKYMIFNFEAVITNFCRVDNLSDKL